MGIGALVGGALGFFGGGGIIGGIVGAVTGIASSVLGKQADRSRGTIADANSVREAGDRRGARRVREARMQRSRASQIKTAMSFDGIGNENGKIPFVRSDQNAPLDEQQSIFQ